MEFFSKFRPLVHIPLIIGGVILIAGLAFLFGFIVMLLWNWLMPEIFGLGTITYWQGWGLVILAHILFKSFPSGHDSEKKKKKCTDEIKEEIKKEIKEEIQKEMEKTMGKEWDTGETSTRRENEENKVDENTEESHSGFEDSSSTENSKEDS
jgi:hypothetical protein